MKDMTLTHEMMLNNGFKHDGMCSWEWEKITYDAGHHHHIHQYVKVTLPDADNEWWCKEATGFIIDTPFREVAIENLDKCTIELFCQLLHLCELDELANNFKM